MEQMLDYAAKTYGDTEFTKMVAGSNNRLEALQGTDLIIQSALVPNSRIRSNESDNDVAVYIGPSGSDTIYTVPLSAVYIINASGTKYQYSTESKQGDMDVSTAQTPSQYSFSDWEDFYLYPAEDGTVHINDFTTNNASRFSLSQAFGGGDSTVMQVAAISSAFPGPNSPLVPTTYSHHFSINRYKIQQNGTLLQLAAFDKAVASLYNQPMLDKFAVCNQWPNPCGSTDGYYIDGGFSDGPTLVINVAQYQTTYAGDFETLKVILTNTNEAWGNDYQYSQILQYFESPINQNIEPGSFNWLPGFSLPHQSTQIFGDYMDASTLDSLIEPITGSNMTTAILKATTIDSPIFGIEAGQQVDILLVNLNEPITTYIATPNIVALVTEPLASMTRNIAENEELAKRVKAFVEPLFLHNGDENVDDTSTPTPSSGQSASWGKQALAFFATALSCGISFLTDLSF